MKDALAERLLARILEWSAEDVARERPILQAMAAFKYDEYEQFSPGMRYVESLARWLSQFDKADRPVAYEFIKTRLVCCSSQEMTHLVETAYTDHIRPLLLDLVAREQSINQYHIGAIADSVDFRVRQRQCLFLGLSDGARIDSFRRANRNLDHEQIWQTHELSADRVKELIEKVTEQVRKIRNAAAGDKEEYRFRTIVLLDDFSASGGSYYMPKPNGTVGGKIAKFFNHMMTVGDPLAELVATGKYEVFILLYVATEQALQHLISQSQNLWGGKGVPFVVKAIQYLPPTISMTRTSDNAFRTLIEKYYDDSIFDEHLKKGGAQDAKYGYADCGLPVVLHHNTPNNAISLLWSYENRAIRGLFPRVQRHKEVT
jgi:hypothetical protein